jgi:hypothetical protein
MKLAQMTVVGLLGLALAAPVFAQPSPGMGDGMQGAGPGSGMGPGAGKGMRFNRDNTAGWSLMSAEERSAHQSKMMSAKSYDECKAMQDEQHKTMAARAKEKGQALPAPRQNGCDRMQARGMFK